MPIAKPVFRFAPSPNGYLHLGHALSALITADMATRFGGRLLLRMEDIDVDRCRPDYDAQILADLAWLGLEWEEPVRRQAEHMNFYQSGIDRLQSLGVLYRCFATRKEIAKAVAVSGLSPYPSDPDGAPIYPSLWKGRCAADVDRALLDRTAFALRIDMERAVALATEMSGDPLTYRAMDESGALVSTPIEPMRWGDVVIARKDVPTSYHLSVVMDDALQGVSHVTRGQDLLAATDIHRVLQVLLGLRDPIYHHHRLITDEDKRKLSKSDQDRTLKSLREEGATREDIRQMVGIG